MPRGLPLEVDRITVDGLASPEKVLLTVEGRDTKEWHGLRLKSTECGFPVEGLPLRAVFLEDRGADDRRTFVFEVTADSTPASALAAECAAAVEVDLFHSGVRLTHQFARSVTAEGSIFSARAIFKKMATATLQTFQRGEYVVETSPEQLTVAWGANLSWSLPAEGLVEFLRDAAIELRGELGYATDSVLTGRAEAAVTVNGVLGWSSDGDAVNLTVPVAMLARMDAESSDLATLDRTELWKHSFALLGQPRKCAPCSFPVEATQPASLFAKIAGATHQLDLFERFEGRFGFNPEYPHFVDYFARKRGAPGPARRLQELQNANDDDDYEYGAWPDGPAWALDASVHWDDRAQIMLLADFTQLSETAEMRLDGHIDGVLDVMMKGWTTGTMFSTRWRWSTTAGSW
jgi:hypothetical protein